MISTMTVEQNARAVEQDVKRYYSKDSPRRVTPPSDDYYLSLVAVQGKHQEQHDTKMKRLLFQRKIWRILSLLLFLIFSISIVIGRCLDPMPKRRQRQGVERPPMVTVSIIAAILSLVSFFAILFQFIVVQRQLDNFRGQLVLENSDADYSPPTTASPTTAPPTTAGLV
jgi:hypothetical protein